MLSATPFAQAPFVQALAGARRIIVRLGVALILDADGNPDSAFMSALAGEIASRRAAGPALAIASSDAAAPGRRP